MFVTSKLWLSDYGYDSALRAFELSLRKLGTGYVDLYLLHWPLASHFEATIESFRAAARVLAEGRVRAIGVSNFGPRHLKTLVERTGVVPAVNQVELHPSFTQRELREANARLGIVTQSCSPLGNSVRRADGPGTAKDPLAHPTVIELAERCRKTPAQVVLRWHIQHGLSAVPKSVRPERIAENIDIFDFELSAADMAAIDALDTGARSGPDPDTVHAATFPIKVED
jgi:2,5-diketo-D-gluconate reductase A